MCEAPCAEAILCKWLGSAFFLATGRSEPYVISTMLPVAACCCLLACIVVVWWIPQLLLAWCKAVRILRARRMRNEHLMSAETNSLMQHSCFSEGGCRRLQALGLECYFSGNDKEPFRSGRCAMCDRWLCGDSWAMHRCQEAPPDGQEKQRCEGVPERG